METRHARIIYPNGSGGITLLIPTGELPIDQTAKKDVPTGQPYKILDVTTLPPEAQYWQQYFAALEGDFTNPDGYGE